MKTLHQVAENIRRCTLCPLWKGRTLPISGDGSESAKVVIIVSSPSVDEDRVGTIDFSDEYRSLALLLKESLDTPCFITPIVKCHPQKRKETQTEIETCGQYLEQQLKIINPKIVIFCGEFESINPMVTLGAKVFMVQKELDIGHCILKIKELLC